jgi:hypothetical protein
MERCASDDLEVESVLSMKNIICHRHVSEILVTWNWEAREVMNSHLDTQGSQINATKLASLRSCYQL